MRYRAFGTTGRNISAITLTMPETLDGRTGVALVYAALESGVNAFELRNPTIAAARTLGQALRAVGRDMAIVVLRIGGGDARGGRQPRDFSGAALRRSIEPSLEAGGIGRFDVVLLDDPQPDETQPDTLPALVAARASGSTALVGMTGQSAIAESAMAAGVLGALGVVYNLRSGTPQRLRIKAAAAQGLVTFGERFHPDVGPSPDPEAPPTTRGVLGWRRRAGLPLEKTGGYEFLTRTSGWRTDEICLAYALTEPGLSSVFVEVSDAQDIARLAAVAERDLPSGLPAQVEMARFAVAS